MQALRGAKEHGAGLVGLQQVIHAWLGIRRTPSTHVNPWLIHALLAKRPRLVDVQSARQSLRQLWVEHRRVRATWHGPAQALRILEERGERMYLSQREPVAAGGLPELVARSLDEFRDIAARYGLLIRERFPVAPDRPVAATNRALGQTVAL